MQTFLPYPDFKKSAEVLDYQRLGKQRVEAKQILQTNLFVLDQIPIYYCNNCFETIFDYDKLDDHFDKCYANLNSPIEYYEIWIQQFRERKMKLSWENHPAVLMWRKYEWALAEYGCIICKEWIKRGYKDNLLEFFEDEILENDEDYSVIYPSWLGNEEFHLSHRSNLLRKNFEHYFPYFGDIPTNLPYYWPVKKEK